MRDPEILCNCDICGEPIPVTDEHYHLPDGDTVCTDCLDRWAEYYLVPGEVDGIYG